MFFASSNMPLHGYSRDKQNFLKLLQFPIDAGFEIAFCSNGREQARTQGGCIPPTTPRGVDMTSLSLKIIAKSIFALHITR